MTDPTAAEALKAPISDGRARLESDVGDPFLKRGPRLLLLVPWFAMGGADKFALDLMGALTKRGWEITVASTSEGSDEWAPLFRAATPDVFSMHRFLPPHDFPRFLAYLIRSRTVDTVMIMHSELGYRLLPFLRHHFPNVTFVDSLHVVEPSWLGGGFPRLAVDYREHLDLSIAASEQVRHWMVAQGADPLRVGVSHLSIDTQSVRTDPDVRRATRLAHGADTEIPVILFAGRICDQKQPLVLADTISRLSRRCPEFVVWIAGDGPDLPLLRAALRFNGIRDTVRLLGPVPPLAIPQLMAAADILFLPSRYEGIATVLFEAMAAGLPVVSADVGGQRELVTDDCGILIAANHPGLEAERYTDALASLLADRDLRTTMGGAGRLRVQSHFRPEAMGSRLVNLLDHATAERSTNPLPQVASTLADSSLGRAMELLGGAHPSQRSWRKSRRRAIGVWMHSHLNRVLAPAYHWGVVRGWRWLPSVGKRIRRMLLGSQRPRA